MNIQYVDLKDIKAYERNAKRHPQDQVETIANSLKEFGWKQPIVIDKNGVIVVGHGRYLAAKSLGYTKAPCIRADDLTDDQIKAYRLADNRTNESDWDDSLLSLELDDISIDMTDFGFDIVDDEEEPDYDDGVRSAFKHNVFDNYDVAQFYSDNYYGIPVLSPTQTTGTKFLRFMDYDDVSDPENYIAHFFYDDYKFIQAWRDPDKYISNLSKFKAVVAPDFSSYTDFPIVLQIMGAYRRNWVGAYWQMKGIDVIPDVQWGNEETYKWCFEGIPKDATVAISSLGVKAQNDWNGVDGDMFKRGFDQMMTRLHPKTILWYGGLIEGCDGNIIHMPSFYDEKRAELNERKEKKNGKGR